MSYFYFNWSSDSQFGNGVDIVTGKTMSTNAFQDPSTVELEKHDNSDSQAQNVFVEDTSTYTSTVDEAVSASASAWGGSVSGSAEYISDASFYSFTLRLMGYDHIEKNKYLANTNGLEMAMSGTPRKLLDASGSDFDPQTFFDTYGLYFISGYIKGGAIIADYTLKFTSQSEMDSLTADVKASYSSFGFSANMDASISEMSESSSSSFTTEANCKVYGGTNAGEVVVSSCQGISDAFNSFADDLGDGDELYAIVQPWTDIPWIADQLKDWEGTAQFFNDDQDSSLSSLSTEYSNQLVMYTTAEQVINNREYTFQSNLDILNTVVDDCNNGMSAITDYMQDPSHVPTNPSDLPSDLFVSASIYDELNSYLNNSSYNIEIAYDLEPEGAEYTWDPSPSTGKTSYTLSESTVFASDYQYIDDIFISKWSEDNKSWHFRIRTNDGQIRANCKLHDSDNWNAYGAAIEVNDIAPGTLQSDWSVVWPAETKGKEVTDSDTKYKEYQFKIRVV